MTTLYKIYGHNSRTLYVGITDNYERRMRQHSEKAWWRDVRRIEQEEFATRAEAEAAERVAIADAGPAWNRMHNGDAARIEVVTTSSKRRGPMPELWTQAQAAEYLGVTDRTIRRLIASGRLPAYRVGARLLRLEPDEVRALLRRIPTTGSDW